MTQIDCFYTPPAVVCKMLNHVCTDEPTHVADFAFGDGRLLKAAQQRWPNIVLLGADISHNAVNDLKAVEPLWEVAQCDFLNEEARSSCPLLLRMLGTVSLVLLNPPFSCKGGTRCQIVVNGEKISCSLAMAFVLTSVQFLSQNGEMIAILPAGTVQSVKDKKAWDKLRELGSAKIVDANDHNVFEGCAPRTIIIRFVKGQRIAVESPVLLGSHSISAKDVHLYRGKFSMNIANDYIAAAGTPLVHSTELRNTVVDLNKRFSSYSSDKVSGPVVLLHRVGKPKLEKMCLYAGNTDFLLSDCVIAMQCRSLDIAKELYAAFRGQWETVEKGYGGTCARYITIETLSSLCSTFGFNPIIGILDRYCEAIST